MCQAALSKKKLKRDGQQQTGERNRRMGRTGRPNGTGSKTLPSARRVALGKDSNFAECQAGSTRRSFELCRVLPCRHSAKFGYVPSATRPALGKVSDFAECQSNCTRRILFPENRKIVALPSVRVITLGKACCFFIFYVFYVITTSISNKAYIHSRRLI